MEKTLEDARWGGGGEEEGRGKEAAAPGPFPAQQLQWMAIGRWRGSREGPSNPLGEEKAINSQVGLG